MAFWKPPMEMVTLEARSASAAWWPHPRQCPAPHRPSCHYIVRQSLGLLVPLFSDAADAAHAVISAQFIFAGHRDGEIREELALAVKICLCLYGVDHAVSDDARLIHGDGDDRHIRLDQTVLLSRTGAGG